MAAIDKLIPLVMKLQDAFNAINSKNTIQLPQIVVVGAQSTGKSSVLESIVGRDFLPRGSGIVTRCPLVLQLRRLEKGRPDPTQIPGASALDETDLKEFGEFLHRKGDFIYDFEEIRNEIIAQTNRTAGAGKNISMEPISLTVYSPYVVDLTLVDLPGMTKVPVQGQPQDIEDQIKQMTLKFITQPNALILALTAANTDLANSDALKLARDVDPDGERTIGVVTKIDLMDEGTDALDLLQGNIYPLKLGYYGVKCRSQKQITDKLSIREAIEKEQEFFSRHPTYSSYSENLGIPFLTKSLNQILIRHIQKCIPNLNKQITSQLHQKERELVVLQTDYEELGKDKGPLILGLINSFIDKYVERIEGKFVGEIAVECLGGARINFIFHHIFSSVINDIDPFEHLTDTDIQTAIKNSASLNPSLFVPEGAFEVLVRQQIARLLEPSLDCAYEVYEELRKLVIDIKIPELARFYRLQQKICDVMETVLNKCLTPTTEMIANLIEIENAHINANHPDFIGSADGMLNMFDPDQQGPQTEEKQFKLMDHKVEEEEKHPDAFDVIEDSSVNEEEEVKQAKGGDKKQSSWGGWLGGGKKDKDVMSEMGEVREEDKLKGVQDSYDTKSSVMLNNDQKRRAKEEKDKKDRNRHEHDLAMAKIREADEFTSPQVQSNGLLPPVNLPQIQHKMRASTKQENPRVLMETLVIKNLIQSYFNLVKKNITDLIPKTIMAFLVNDSRRKAQSELVEIIYKESDLDSLVVEDPMIRAQRDNCKKAIDALKTAQNLLGEVTQYKAL